MAGEPRMPLRVLLVEDDPDIRSLFGDVLVEDYGYAVTACASAEEALKALRTEHYPLALLDWMLPGMSGLDLCRHIRTLERGEECVVVVMTARTQPDDLRAVLDAGADDYVPKPIDLSLFDIRMTIAEQRVREVEVRVRAQRAAEEAARLEGVLLAARTAAHEINNALALPVGYAELLTLHPTIQADPDLLQQVQDIMEQAQRAADTLARLQRVIRLEELPPQLSPAGPMLDLQKSARPA